MNKKEIINTINSHLQNLTSKIILNINQSLLILPKDLAHLDFETQHDDFSTTLYPMNSENCQCTENGTSIIYSIIESEAIPLTQDLVDDKYAEDDEYLEKIDGAIYPIFSKWFISCWLASNAKDIGLNSYFSFHDSEEIIHLNTGKKVKEIG